MCEEVKGKQSLDVRNEALNDDPSILYIILFSHTPLLNVELSLLKKSVCSQNSNNAVC